jgi:hypothetical protein
MGFCLESQMERGKQEDLDVGEDIKLDLKERMGWYGLG